MARYVPEHWPDLDGPQINYVTRRVQLWLTGTGVEAETIAAMEEEMARFGVAYPPP